MDASETRDGCMRERFLMRCGTTFLLWFCLAALLGLPCRAEERTPEPLPTFASLAHPTSVSRIDLLKKELLRAVTLHQPSKASAALQRAVEAGYVRAEKVPSCPIHAAISEESCHATATAAAQRVADVKFPPLDQEALTKEAEGLYTIIPIGQAVTVNYRINPVRISSITGSFKGKMGEAAVIGNHRILFQDMLPPPPREKLAVQFDQQLALAKRREHVDRKLLEYEKSKNDFLATETNRLYTTELATGAAANEQAGYIWLEDRWESPRTLIKRMIGANLAKLEGVYERVHPRTPAPKPLAQAMPQPRESRNLEPDIDPELLVSLTTDAEEEEDASALKTGEESPRAAASTPPEDMKPQQPRTVATPRPAEAVGEESNRLKWAVVGVLGLILLSSGVWLTMVFKPRPKGISRYYETKDAAEHGFWANVESSGGTLAHVAYSFPDYAAAFEAMAQLSFVEEAVPNRPIMSSEGVDLGAYMQEHAFVAFVGGEKMTYAMWHETVAAFRGTNKAVEYRCSETPKPNLTLPDPATVPGCENSVVLERAYDGEGDDFSHYVVYTAPERKTADTFLKSVKIHEAAVQVVVQTPEGHWGKDFRGLYKE